MPNDKTFESNDNSHGDNSQGAQPGSNQHQDQGASGGEGGDTITISKKDYEAMSRRIDDSQSFIKTLKDEGQAYRQEIEALKNSQLSMDDILEQVRQSQGDQHTSIDPNDIANKAAEVIESRLTAKEKQKLKDNNFNTVKSTLQRELGAEGLNTKITDIAAENGMSFDEFVQMAETSPKAALKIAGIKEKAPDPVPTKGSYNTSAYGNQPTKSNDKPKNIMDMRSEKERVAYFEQAFKEAGV